jgi:hypothetical protein
MALLHTGDLICASCGGINGRHQSACTGDESVEVISVYGRLCGRAHNAEHF